MADRVTSPFPEVGHLYLLVGGLLMGVLLGPAVLGRVMPGVYDRWFVGSGDSAVARRVAEADAQIAAEIGALEATGVTDVALQEHEARRVEETLPLRLQLMQARAAKQSALAGWMNGLLVALAVVMAVEALASPSPRPGERVRVPFAAPGLVTARYGLMAGWLALAVAQPALLQRFPVLFALLALAVVLLASMVPLGPRVRSDEA